MDSNAYKVLYVSDKKVGHSLYLSFFELGMEVVRFEYTRSRFNRLSDFIDNSNSKIHSIIIDVDCIDELSKNDINMVLSIIDVIKIIRSKSLSKIERIQFMNSGIDDIVINGMDEDELAVKMINLIQRVFPNPEIGFDLFKINYGKIRLDPETRLLKVEGEETLLTDGEHQILLHLIGNRGRYNSRQELSKALGKNYHSISSRSIDMLIGRLRRKIHDDPKKPEYIVTSRGQGYMLTDQYM
ncbi:response regulator transcription factor [Vibrio kyushuensis]|uniref:winged helix-turn-helix domain-containing protein n=1 Tax=Vibrio kyushuensis TaxID=2910249 RepID=UPI003D0D5CEA